MAVAAAATVMVTSSAAITGNRFTSYFLTLHCPTRPSLQIKDSGCQEWLISGISSLFIPWIRPRGLEEHYKVKGKAGKDNIYRAQHCSLWKSATAVHI